MKSIKVTTEYLGQFRSGESHDYKITKIIGAPTVEIQAGAGYIPGRVGEIISEKQAEELANRVEVTTIPKSLK